MSTTSSSLQSPPKKVYTWVKAQKGISKWGLAQMIGVVHCPSQVPFLLLSKPLISRSCQRIWQCIPFMHIPEQVEIARFGQIHLVNWRTQVNRGPPFQDLTSALNEPESDNNSHSSLRDVCQYWDEELKIRGCSTVRNGWRAAPLSFEYYTMYFMYFVL